MKNDDVELIQNILAGDESAFVSLVNKYQKQVHALAWRKIGDFHIAEEITQDTFLKVYQKLSTLKNPKQFSGWLYVIATNQCRAWLRKKRLETESFDDTEWVDASAYSKYVAEEQAKVNVETQREVVKKLLAKLKESERTVLTLHYFGEMTIEEISRFLGVSASAIKLRLHRARQRLQKEEPMIREAISNFQLSPNLTDNIIQKIDRIKPATPSGSKPFIPWMIGASSIALIVLMLGLGSRYLAYFQQPYSLDSQSELAVELVDAPIVLNLEMKPNVRNQLGKNLDDIGKGDDSGEEANQVSSDKGNYTQRNLPKGAKARLGKGSINDISFSPDGTQIAVGSATGVWIYDAHTGAELSLLTDHTSEADRLTFSPDGKTLASAKLEKILLWDTASGKLLKSFIGYKKRLELLRILDDGKTLLCLYHDGTACIWDLTTDVKKDMHAASTRGIAGSLRSLQGESVFTADLYLDKNNDNGIFAIGTTDGKIILDDAATGRRLKTIQDNVGGTVKQLVFSPDGTLLVAESPYRSIVLWDIATGQSVKILTNSKQQGILSFTKDSKTLVCQVGSGEIQFWDVATKVLRTTLGEELDTPIHVLALSPDSKTVTGANQDGNIYIWNVTTGDEIVSFSTRHTSGPGPLILSSSPGTLVFSPDSSTLVSLHGKAILLWDTHNFVQLPKHIDFDAQITTLVFSQDGRTATTAGEFTFKNQDGETPVKENVLGSFSIWDTSNWRKMSDFPVESHTMLPGRKPAFTLRTEGKLMFSQNGYMFATVLNQTRASKDNRFSVLLWEVPDGKLQFWLKGHTDRINALAFTPNGRMLASASDDKTIRLWDASIGTEILSLPSDKSHALAFSVDGKILASASLNKKETILLWNIATGKQLSSLKGQKGYINILVFSNDSKILASGSTGGTIYLWDIATGNKLSILKGHTSWVNSLTFSSDGNTLASGSSDGAIFLWNLPSY